MPEDITAPEEAGTTLLDDPELLLVGRVVAAHGIKGGVRVLCSASARDKFIGLSGVDAQFSFEGENEGEEEVEILKIVGVQQNKGALVFYLEGICDRDGAEALLGGDVFIRRSQVPELDEDEWWTRDLIGFEAYTVDGKLIGTICDIISSGNCLLEVQPADPSRKNTILIPFVKELIPFVKTEERRVEVKPLPGLLEL